MLSSKLLFELVFEIIVRSRFQELFELLHLFEQHLRADVLTRPGLLELMFCSKLLFDSVFEIIVRSRFQELFELLYLFEQNHEAGDLTRPGQRPGELRLFGHFGLLGVGSGPWLFFWASVVVAGG